MNQITSRINWKQSVVIIVTILTVMITVAGIALAATTGVGIKERTHNDDGTDTILFIVFIDDDYDPSGIINVDYKYVDSNGEEQTASTLLYAKDHNGYSGKESGCCGDTTEYEYEYYVTLEVPADGQLSYVFIRFDGHSDTETYDVSIPRASAAPTEAPKFTVSFDSHEGTAVDAITDILLDETIAAPTTNVERAGYSFEGWFTDESLETSFIFDSTPITADITLHAKWDIVEYTITYDGEGTHDNPATYTVESDDIVLTEPERKGYNFVRWDESDTIPKGSTGDKTFTAVWEAITYSITYNTSGGTHSNPTTYNIETASITLSPAQRSGYSFVRWDEGATIPKGSTGSKSFTAVWKLVTYTITYTDGGDTNPNPVSYTIKSDNITLQDPQREGYNFLGWEPAGVIPNGSTGNKAFTATWELKKYTVDFDSTGGSTVDSINDVVHGTKINEPTEPEFEGNIFRGWYTDDTYEQKWDFTENTVTAPMTLYANWEKITYTVHLDTSGGEEMNDITDVIHGSTIDVIDTPIRAGYEFRGWYADNDFVQEWDLDSDPVISDMTLFANWEIITYTITYVLNGGNHEGNPVSYTVETPTIFLSDAYREDAQFDGWSPMNYITKGSTGNKTFTANFSQYPRFASAPMFYQISTVLYPRIMVQISNVLTDNPCTVYYLITDAVLNPATELSRVYNPQGNEVAGSFQSDGDNIAGIAVNITGSYDIEDEVYCYLLLRSGTALGDFQPMPYIVIELYEE